MTVTNIEIATTIRQQLGNMALSMLGACDLVAIENGLMFRIKGSKKTNKIRIVLEPSDTYTVSFWKIRPPYRLIKAKMVQQTAAEMVSEASDVYVDCLHSVIESHTGLYTRM